MSAGRLDAGELTSIIERLEARLKATTSDEQRAQLREVIADACALREFIAKEDSVDLPSN